MTLMIGTNSSTASVTAKLLHLFPANSSQQTLPSKPENPCVHLGLLLRLFAHSPMAPSGVGQRLSPKGPNGAAYFLMGSKPARSSASVIGFSGRGPLSGTPTSAALSSMATMT